MTGELETAHEQLADQVPHMEGVGRGVEPDVEPDRPLRETGGQRVAVGAVVYQAACGEFGEQIHKATMLAGEPPDHAPDETNECTPFARLPVMVTPDELAARFREFAGASTARAPLYRHLSTSIADDPEVAGLLHAAPDEQAIPVLLFAAVHHLVLDDPGLPLAAFYPNLTDVPADGDPYPEFRRFALAHGEQIREIVRTRHTQTNEVGRCALFLPALGLVSDEVGALSIVDVGTSAGLNLVLNHYSYEFDPGGRVGAHSTVHLVCSTRGAPPVPATMPVIAAAIGLDAQLIDVHDDDGVRWLEACVWPDQADRFHRLLAAVDLVRQHGVDVRRGDAVSDLAPLVREAAAAGHPVVMNSWVLNYLAPDQRVAYVSTLDEVAKDIDLSWVLAESPAQTAGLPVPTTDPPEDLTILSLVRWRSGVRSVTRLAACHPHGYWMHWEADAR